MNASNSVRVRFAPSPTGYLHIGGARTCLFNWLHSRKHKGAFILRIEDTDVARSKKEYLDEILESIQWLGMDWDELYYQSKRFSLYCECAKKLVGMGRAYEKEGAIFFKYDFTTIEIDDLIRGKIIFSELPKEEEVIIKSDGSPTYNFSCVVDDALLNISDVIRGEDHISNTPKQVLMYAALGFKLPRFAHVPLILSPEGGRLSKRFGATSIREYREDGYLAQALVNYLMLLSWSAPNDKEILSLSEARELFDIKDINKTAAEFSLQKLTWMNGEYIRKKTTLEFAGLACDYLRKKNCIPEEFSDTYITNVVLLFKERIEKLSDLINKTYYFFHDDYTYSDDAKELLVQNLSETIEVLIKNLSLIDDFKKDPIEKELRQSAEDLGLKAKDLIHPVRVALTGSRAGPGLFETMEVLGKERVINRLKRLINYWRDNA